ncbi:MAG: hypothetical protein LBC94_10070 [Desulfovibrio sp.]|jgi:hypothetical protein|nr:hypothetical protein [Desulfovibrio sp.]
MIAAENTPEQSPVVHILWDASHIWGLMAWRAMMSLGLSCRLLKAKDIADGALLGKPEQASLLLVPGGSARRKALALGERGREAVRFFVERGGSYLGFCGGAGLALSHEPKEQGLQICPLRRAVYAERLHHLISGHVLARMRAENEFVPPGLLRKGVRQGCLSLPVWWPGRFEMENGGSAAVSVLADYSEPDRDFCIADMSFRRIPKHIFAHWQEVYGVNLSADFLAGQPLAVSGRYGLGRYALSYSHLETPHSPEANAWLAAVVGVLVPAKPACTLVRQWDLRRVRPSWPDTRENAPLLSALRRSHALLRLALQHRLFFVRTPWLAGWRAGLPGAALNSLHAALCTAASLVPSEAALEYWHTARKGFTRAADLFFPGAEGWLLAFRLAQTLVSSLPRAVDRRGLDEQQAALFGQPMQGGGLLEELIAPAEELVYLSHSTAPPPGHFRGEMP